ncbi:MAG: hypothetical protein ACK559_34730, partial [bacterium]
SGSIRRGPIWRFDSRSRISLQGKGPGSGSSIPGRATWQGSMPSSAAAPPSSPSSSRGFARPSEEGTILCQSSQSGRRGAACPVRAAVMQSDRLPSRTDRPLSPGP